MGRVALRVPRLELTTIRRHVRFASEILPKCNLSPQGFAFYYHAFVSKWINLAEKSSFFSKII
jgi:hypothetical protein